MTGGDGRRVRLVWIVRLVGSVAPLSDSDSPKRCAFSAIRCGSFERGITAPPYRSRLQRNNSCAGVTPTSRATAATWASATGARLNGQALSGE